MKAMEGLAHHVVDQTLKRTGTFRHGDTNEEANNLNQGYDFTIRLIMA